MRLGNLCVQTRMTAHAFDYLRYVLHIFLFIFCLHTVCIVIRVRPDPSFYRINRCNFRAIETFPLFRFDSRCIMSCISSSVRFSS